MQENENLDVLFNRTVGKVLKEHRIKQKKSLQFIADKLGTTRQAIFRYEKAEVTLKKTTFEKICMALNEEPQQIFNEISKRFYEYSKDNNFDDIKK